LLASGVNGLHGGLGIGVADADGLPDGLELTKAVGLHPLTHKPPAARAAVTSSLPFLATDMPHYWLSA